MEILPPKKIKLTEIEGKGRGIIALEDIKKGEIIEICPLIPMQDEEAEFFEKKETVLNFYYLQQPEFKKNCLMLGYGSIYNHSKEPNAEIDYDTNELKDYLFFKALKNIKAGEEIVYDYQFDNNKEKFLKLK
jgi:SET domain-containing protein